MRALIVATVMLAASSAYADAPAFIGTWGLADGSEDACASYNSKVFTDSTIESDFAHIQYDGATEIAPGHWQIDAYNLYEGQRIELGYEVVIEGNTMREIVTSASGDPQEMNLARCN